jgi:hypothetical protein
LLALLGLLAWPAAQAWADGGPIPVATDSVFYWRFDVKIGPSAFTRPTGPWYSYFPVDPNLLAQPRASAFPNWPTPYPPQVGGFGYQQSAAPYYQPAYQPGYQPGFQPGYQPNYQPVAATYPYYPYGGSIYPAGYYAPPGYWYGR